mgnify:CR=1 FL=1
MDIPVNAAKPGRRRYLTLVMIFITVVICYVDRANLAVASAHIQEEFGITKAEAVARSHWAHSDGNAANSGPELFEPLYRNINKKVEDGTVLPHKHTRSRSSRVRR